MEVQIMVFTDGLWISSMTLQIKRDDAPIPQEMRESYIELELTATQMKAIAAVLGLGYRDGELLYYKDADVANNITRDDGKGVATDYYMIESEERKRRIAHRINKPFSSSSISKKLVAVAGEDGVFDFDVKREQ